MNLGKFDYIGRTYTKFVCFNKAVLWKDRQLSIPLPVLSIIGDKIDRLIFVDRGKHEKWIFDKEKVMLSGERKMVGQEPQWYFPIELAKKVKI
jgi:hypothetical protein